MPRPHSIRSLQMPSRHHDANGHPFPVAPPSPSLSTTTRASLDFPSRPAVLITRADLRTSLAAYEALLASAKAYTSAMLSMAKASSDLACALETCARVKGAHESGPGLQAASGLHFLKSNYEQVLCDTFWKDFSIPLLSHYDTYRSACTDRQVSHDKAVSEKSKELKEAEARNNRAGRKKERDLNSFRRALAELQSHVDAIDELKAQYYNEVLDAEQEVWQFIESKVALIVRSQIEISERISSKGLNDPVLEQMLATIPDPFGSYGPPKQDGEIFSILPPISLLSSGANSVHNTSTEAATNDTSVTDADLTSEEARAASTGATNGASKSKSVLPANIMSPSTPSKGLSRGLSSSSSKKLGASATPTRASSSHANAAADDLPVLDDDHFRAIVLKLGQDVRRDDERHARAAQRRQQAGKIAPGLRIEPRRRLVQKQHLRFVDDGLPDAQALTQAARQFSCLGLQPVRKADALGGFRDRRIDSLCRQSVRPGGICQTAAHGQFIVEAVEIGQIAKPCMDFARVFARIHAVNRDRSGIWGLQRREAAQQRRLPCAIRAHQGHDGLRRHAQGHAF